MEKLFGCKEYNQSDFGVDHLVMSMSRVFSCAVGRGCLLWPVHSLGKILLAFALLHTPRPNLPVTPGNSWLPTFAFQSPMMRRTSFLVLVVEDLLGHHRTIQLQLLQHFWLGHRLGSPWHRMVCLGNEEIILSFSRLHPSTAFRTLWLTMRATPFLLRASCPQ